MAKYFLALTISLVLLLAFLFCVYKFKQSKMSISLKALALITAILLIFRYCLDDLYVESLLFPNAVDYGYKSQSHFNFAVVLHWIEVPMVLAIILYPFFKGVKTLRFISAFICPVILIVSAIFLKDVLFTNFGNEIFEKPLRAMLLTLEIAFALAISLICLTDYIVNVKKQDYTITKSLVVAIVLSFAGMIMCTMPNYVPQIFLNPYDYLYKVVDLNLYHRLYVYPAAIIPIALYLLLRNKSDETRRFSLIYYSLAALFLFTLTHKFEDFTRVSGLPFHLCNTALYITPICLIFKEKKVFYFTYFINVLGAFFAMVMPNYNTEGIISGSVLVHNTIYFYRPHWQAFFMPLLVVGLGIFPRPRIKEFRYSLIGFAVYYILMLVLNGWFTNYDSGIDYFFINSDFVAGKLGTWAENLRKVVWSFKINDLNFTYYPIYQSLYFIVYVLLSLAMWFIYELAYETIYGWKNIAEKNRKIKVDELALSVALNGRTKEQPMDITTTNKLILKNFTKRYGTSDVYAVKDANLEVTGGEVFGFLGPNGAGKSTIIKSIVGIQTITEGAITVCGYDVNTQSVEAKSQIGFVPDHYALYEKLTAREYVNYVADLYNVSKEDRDERLGSLIKQFEFEVAIDNPIKTYSHGMKQKVTIMSALIHDPKVWILDEPLTGLDPNSIFQVKECMKNHAKKGNIVFFSSHIIDVVEKICDKIAIIRKGQIQCVKTVEEIEKQGSLENFYMSVINDSEVEAIAVNDKHAKQNN